MGTYAEPAFRIAIRPVSSVVECLSCVTAVNKSKSLLNILNDIKGRLQVDLTGKGRWAALQMSNL